MVIVLLIAMIGAAPAEDGRDEFQLGRRYYLEQRYDDALPWLERAYKLSKHRPSTILGLAQCERALGHLDDALLHYREYLATVPPEDEAATIRLEIGVLESSKPLPLPKKEEEPPPQQQQQPLVAPIVVVTQPPPEKRDEPTIFDQPIFWLAVAATLVAVGTGTALALNTRSETTDPWGGTLGNVLHR